MIYIDTGAFLARYMSRDQHHVEAGNAWEKLSKGRNQLFTSNFVLDETFTLLARRAGYDFAAQKAKSIYSSQSLTILRPDYDHEIDALAWFEKYSDHEISFTDCVSFALLKANRIKRVFSFDQHFKLAGFELWPKSRIQKT
ncbi:MAG: PIN domain-containing protein [Planctomycetota bacterium]|nr:PIN domain-containing protein [Planctomycetota bacterium]MDP6503726.1 PIN domain-containing protein [Planctomycetota bacterium]